MLEAWTKNAGINGDSDAPTRLMQKAQGTPWAQSAVELDSREFRDGGLGPSQHAPPSPSPPFAPALQVLWPVRSASRTACANGWWIIRETRWGTSRSIARGQTQTPLQYFFERTQTPWRCSLACVSLPSRSCLLSKR